MKIGGRSLDLQNQKSVSFYRLGKEGPVEFTFLVTPLPWGWLSAMETRGLLDYPAAPKEILRDDKGKPIVNPETGKVDYVENYRGPKFIRAFNACTQRLDALRFRDHLRDDPEVAFDVKTPADGAEKDAWIKYANRLLAEIKAAGFTEAEFATVVKAGEELSVVTEIEKDVAGFLPVASEPSSNGRSSPTPTTEESPTETRMSSKG